MIRLFVFGTLRPGGALHHSIEEYVVSTYEDVRVSGKMFHTEGSTTARPFWPVVDFQQQGIVVGTLLLVHLRALEIARGIEEPAGYVERLVRWSHPRIVAVGRHAHQARSFHWPHPERGAEVLSGDWNLERSLLPGQT